MKQGLTITAIKKNLQQVLASVALFIVLMIPGDLFAQTDSSKKAEPVTEKESSLISPSIEFISIQKGDNSIDLKAALKAKIKGTFYKLPLLKIKFLQVTDTIEKELGFVITDRIGSAVFNCKPNSVTTDKEGKLHFKAVFAGNKSMDPADAEVTIKRARLEINPVKGDSLLTANVKLVDVGTGKEIPVKDIVLGIFVQRSFFPLKVGEGTTDENGEATVEIPNNLPGDAKGMITLLTKLDESELYGNLEASTTAKWGIPVSDILQEAPRALWSAHPPVWMMVTFAVLMIVVWGHYIVIVYELFRLRKEEPHSQPVNQINT
ncbi:MAG: hypothetical protein ABI666_12570 [Ferruginibacter sp.]